MTPFILVLYHSRNGSVLNLAKTIARGAKSTGIEVKVRSVEPNQEYPEVSKEELIACSGLAVGSPCRFGNMSAKLKSFWEQTSAEWIKGELIDKPGCVFTSSSTMHGGNEATLLSMSLPLLHHGMMLVGVPYTESELNSTETGGTPYGPSHVSGLQSSSQLSDSESSICYAMGQRLAHIAQKLNI
jgi:NAD(P)H dehydrogenase (quinone)